MKNRPSPEEQRRIDLYLEAKDYIDRDIVRLVPRRRDRFGKVQTALEFNTAVGDPQRAYPSVQIAGTSGKGSVAHYLSEILVSAGYSTGMHISPYLQVATEKTWLNGRFASPESFFRAYRKQRPVTEKYRWDYACPASVHGMASLALSYEIFREEAIDVCVMETGLGGRFDLVQGLRRELALITDIGLDHTKALGEDRKSISWHKAGIIQGSKWALAVYDPETWPVFQEEAEREGVRLEPVTPERTVTLRGTEGDGWLASGELPHIGTWEIPVPGYWSGYPRRNLAVALEGADRLAAMGYRISADHCRAVTRSFFAGRMEEVQRRPRVILDGAHNAQKMAGLVDTLRAEGRSLVLVFGVTGLRKVEELLGAFRGGISAAILSRPDLYGKEVAEPQDLLSSARKFALSAQVVTDPEAAVAVALEHAQRDGSDVLVTGSLYLVGQARNYWYPWTDVLLQRTSCPTRSN